MDMEMRKFREEFFDSLKKAEKLKHGIYDIKIEEVLCIGGRASSLPEIAIIRDDHDRILAIPEDRGENGQDSLVSCFDMTKGMRLRLFVKGSEILKVLEIGA